MTKANFRLMIQHDALGGVILVIAAIMAMIVANSSLNGLYQSFLKKHLIHSKMYQKLFKSYKNVPKSI